MTTAAFDPRMGASGDMLLGALLDSGADPAALEPVEAALGVTIDVESVTDHGIAASDVTVAADDSSPHRTFDDVVDIVTTMALPDDVETTAVATFQLLAEAEAAVHGTDVADTHFHEVGADDAVADIVGTYLLLDDLEVDRVVTTPGAAGGGEVEMSHGRYPVPAPAVTEIAARSDLEIYGGPVDVELLTPTGAAILASAATHVSALPTMSVAATGYGAGDRRVDARPNLLRVLVGERRGGLVEEDLTVLETNVDDATPETLGHLHRRMREAGALDVSVVPMTMKKSRPGHLIRVIATPADEERLARVLAEETGSLGIRAASHVHRWVLERYHASVAIEIGGTSREVGVKIAHDRDGEIVDVSAEYEDAASVAEDAELPVRDVLRRAEAVAREELAGETA